MERNGQELEEPDCISKCDASRPRERIYIEKLLRFSKGSFAEHPLLGIVQFQP